MLTTPIRCGFLSSVFEPLNFFKYAETIYESWIDVGIHRPIVLSWHENFSTILCGAKQVNILCICTIFRASSAVVFALPWVPEKSKAPKGDIQIELGRETAKCGLAECVATKYVQTCRIIVLVFGSMRRDIFIHTYLRSVHVELLCNCKAFSVLSECWFRESRWKID